VKARLHVGGRDARPNHEGPGPSPGIVTSRPQVGTPSPALPHPQPATGKAKGRAMVFRRKWARRILLRAGNDDAAGAGKAAESCDFLPWRSNHGAAERLGWFPQRLKMLRKKSARETKLTSGAKARHILSDLTARVNSCPSRSCSPTDLRWSRTGQSPVTTRASTRVFLQAVRTCRSHLC